MVTDPLLAPTSVEIEVSYREAVIDPADVAMIGAPSFEEFQVLVMTVSEMSAEKLRTLAQRTRPTDLADLALMLQRDDGRDDDIGRLAVHKFKDVAAGANTNIERNLRFIGADYDNVVPGLSPDAPTYREAMEIVSSRIKPLIP
jgi:predicted nucleotidyltransferase component of viral defense system